MNETTTAKERWGILGGTFDPIHIGHLILAEEALRSAGLQKVLFVPAFQAPLREGAPTAQAEERWQMVQLALANFPHFSPCDYEIIQKRKVYSWETVQHLCQMHTEVDFSFLIGEDQAQKLPQWQKIEQLAEMVTFLCARRSVEQKVSMPPVQGLRLQYYSSRRIDISATEVRELLAVRAPAYSLLLPEVAKFIEDRGLYRSPSLTQTHDMRIN